MFQLGSVSTGTLAPEFVTGNPPAYQSFHFAVCPRYPHGVTKSTESSISLPNQG